MAVKKINSFRFSGLQYRLQKIPLYCFMKSFAIVSLLVILNSCVLKTERNTRYARSNYADIFQAAVQAVHDIDFSVVANDFKTGMIVAEKSFFEKEKSIIASHLNISVEPSSSGIKVLIKIFDESTEIEGRKKHLKEFVKALKKRAPAHLNVKSY